MQYGLLVPADVIVARRAPALRSACHLAVIAPQRVMDSDLALVGRWRTGDKRAGEELFARHFTDIYRFLANRAGDAADELAQQTFLACVQGRDRFRGGSTFRTYLFAIARKQLYSHLRTAAAKRCA